MRSSSGANGARRVLIGEASCPLLWAEPRSRKLGSDRYCSNEHEAPGLWETQQEPPGPSRENDNEDGSNPQPRSAQRIGLLPPADRQKDQAEVGQESGQLGCPATVEHVAS